MGPPRSLPGLVAGRYRLEERLGSGGGGQVFRARDERTGNTVALKLLRDPRVPSEAERLVAVRHPHLVRVLEVRTAPEGAYAVMEALEGPTLREVLARRGPVDLVAALGVVLPVLDALHAAHAHGLVHGDLTPDNVLLHRSAGGAIRVVLLDLGGVPPAGEGDAVVGSPGYLSPEQAAGEVLDARSDVFGAGLLLFELVTGRAAFPAASPVAAAYAVVHGPAPRVADPRLQPLLDVALARSPADRLPSAAAFAVALAELREAVARDSRAPAEPSPDADLSAGALSALVTP